MNSNLENWVIREDQDCKNYTRAKEWALTYGYNLRDDVSHNGFIVIERKFCITTDPMDGHSLQITIYTERDIVDRNKSHHYQQSDMDAEFGNIMDATKYRLKFATNTPRANFSDKDLEIVLNKALEREKELIQEFILYLKGV